MQAGEGAAHDFGPMKETLTKIIAECAVAVPVSRHTRLEQIVGNGAFAPVGF